MARNVEIKARSRDFERQARLAEELGDGDALHLEQKDTFFHVLSGRLKLREFGDGSGELIQYEREDTTGPTESHYVCSPTASPATLEEALTLALGVRAVVRKQRTVFLAGRTRIHLDRVEGLGEFLELEVVLEPGEEPVRALAIATVLMEALEIEPSDLVESAYVDLLEARPGPLEPRTPSRT